MTEQTEPFLVIDRPARPMITLSSKSDAQAFIDREKQLWTWIPGQFNHNYAQIGTVANRYRLERWTERFNDTLKEANKNQFEQLMRQRYSTDQCLCAIDPEAEAIHSIGQTDARIGIVALATIHGEAPTTDQNFYRDLRDRIGIAHGAALLAGVDSSVVKGALTDLQVAREANEREAQRMRALIDVSLDNSIERAETIETAAAKLGQTHEERFLAAEAERAESYSRLREQLDATLKAFEIQMELQAPVAYWKARARQYRRGSHWAIGFLVTFAIAAAVGLFLLYDLASAHLPADAANVPYAALFRASAFALLMTSIAFWIGRVLLRIYFSARHLATDAEERRTMITTFLALTKKSVVKDDDRKFILAALFRPGADGIVSEESAPDTMFAALMGSILKK
jgi:hypothetical protein